MVQLTNIGVDTVSIYAPAGDPDSLTVEPDQTVDVPGELADPQPYADAVVIVIDGQPLAFPTSRWELVEA